MKKICFIFSGILTLIGIISLLFSTIIFASLHSVVPAINQLARPDEIYVQDFTVPNIMAITCIVIGIILCFYFYKKELHNN